MEQLGAKARPTSEDELTRRYEQVREKIGGKVYEKILKATIALLQRRAETGQRLGAVTEEIPRAEERQHELEVQLKGKRASINGLKEDQRGTNRLIEEITEKAAEVRNEISTPVASSTKTTEHVGNIQKTDSAIKEIKAKSRDIGQAILGVTQRIESAVQELTRLKAENELLEGRLGRLEVLKEKAGQCRASKTFAICIESIRLINQAIITNPQKAIRIAVIILAMTGIASTLAKSTTEILTVITNPTAEEQVRERSDDK